MTICPCGSEKSFDACCGPLIAGAPAATAEALMRSRYTAYARGDIDYILTTHDADAGEPVDREATEKWSRETTWLGLKILSTERGGPSDTEGKVEFVATHRAAKGGPVQLHHELAVFSRPTVGARWLFIDGAPVRPVPVKREEHPGRNEPCSCGSGKKYKKCHGA